MVPNLRSSLKEKGESVIVEVDMLSGEQTQCILASMQDPTTTTSVPALAPVKFVERPQHAMHPPLKRAAPPTIVSLANQEAPAASHATQAQASVQSLLGVKFKKVKTSTPSNTKTSSCASRPSNVSLASQETKARVSNETKTSAPSATKTISPDSPPVIKFTHVPWAPDARNVNGDNVTVHPGVGTPKPNLVSELVVASAKAAVNKQLECKIHPKHKEVQLLHKKKMKHFFTLTPHEKW